MSRPLPIKVRMRVSQRSGMRCERCGRNVVDFPSSAHHRRTKGMGGAINADFIENLAHLCGDGVRGCHGWVTANPEQAAETGWYVHQWENPADVVMTNLNGDKFLFSGDRRVPA